MIIKLLIKSTEILVLEYFVNILLKFFKNNNVKIRGPIFLPKKIKRFVLLRSPSSDKDSRICFKICYYKYFIYLIDINCNILKKMMMINTSPMLCIFIRLL